MASRGYADSVFGHELKDPPRPRGVRLRTVALVAMAMAALPVVVLWAMAGYAWWGGETQADSQRGWLMLGIGVFLAVYGALAGWLALRWVVMPLRDVAFAMRQIERGDYPRSPSQLPHLREIQQMQSGLQAMWSGLERRRNERDAALLASDAARQQMHAVLHQMDEGFMIVDSAWRLTFCNKRAGKLVGKSAGLEKLPFWDLFPEDKRRNRKARCIKEVEQGKSVVMEDYHSRYERWLEMRFFPSPGGIGVFVRDVTERRRMTDELIEREQRYRELFEANPNVMWIFDEETLGFLAVNSAAIQLYGYSRQEFLGMKISDLRPEDEQAQVADQMRNSLAKAGTSLHDRPRIWRHVARNGSLMLVEVANHPIKFQERDARLVMVRDVTARQKGEAQLQRRHERLVVAHNEATGTLRAAQQVVAGYARLLSDEVLPMLALVQMQVREGPLHDKAVELDSLLRDMQSLMQVPTVRLQAEPVDLSEMAQQQLQRLRLAEPQRRVHVEIEPGLLAEGDAPMLRQLVAALLDNAWKFSAKGVSPWIRMGRMDQDASPVASFFISDNGVGFDELQQARMWLPFERLHSQGEYRGHGLGLAIARAVVARHGGRLWAQSRPGQGATFCFELAPRPQDSGFHVAEVVIDSVASDDDDN